MSQTVVACTRVRDGLKYVDRWMTEALALCRFVCVADDGSTDGTAERLQWWASRNQNVFLHLSRSPQRQEGSLCRVLHDMAAAFKPDWVYAPDIDEFLDQEDVALFPRLTAEAAPDVLAWTFPFYYLWDNPQQYRLDGDYQKCHVIRLYRFDKTKTPPPGPRHAQMCPAELDRRRVRAAPVRMVHYGYMEQADRQAKYDYYRERDKDPLSAGAGVKSYDHFLGVGADLRPYPSRAQWTAPQMAYLTAMLGRPS